MSIDILKEELVTLAQVAEKLREKSPKSVRRWAANGELEIVHVGKTPKTTWAAVNAYLNRESDRPAVVRPEKPVKKASQKQLRQSAARAVPGLKRHGFKEKVKS